jgi:hypothetical protein
VAHRQARLAQVEMDIAPSQREQLAWTQAGRRADEDDRAPS